MEQPDAATLTAIGIGTAFGVLALLLGSALLIRLVSWAVRKYTRAEDAEADAPEEAERTDPEMRNRARAAAIAVAALIESRPHLDIHRESDQIRR